MSKVFGIDLGTTYSVIATLDDNGTPEVIENFHDSVPLLASAVYFPEGGGDPVIGKEAKNQTEMYPDRVVQFIKREIGKDDAVAREFDGVQYNPITISALILKRMKEYAQDQGYEVNDVVITCPAYFGIPERDATKQAGIIAGFNVLDVINEPTAAALNYCCREFRENRKIMVYDLGGGTFDVTVFDMMVSDAGESTIDVIDSAGDDRLGGIDWDARLYDYIAELYADETGVSKGEMDATLRQMLRAHVEDSKRSLSRLPSRNFTVNYAGDSTRLEVTRDEFEKRTQDLVTRTTDFVHQLLSQNELSANDIDVVLLVGGSTLMPMIKAAIDAIFPGKVRFEQPDLAVAKGAALAAAVQWNEKVKEKTQSTDGGAAPELTQDEAEKQMINVPAIFAGGDILNDKLSRSFGPGTLDSSHTYIVDNLLFMGDPSPSEATSTYGPVVDNQPAVLFRVFENVSADRENTSVTPSVDVEGNEQYTDPALKVKCIGELSLPLPPGTRAGTPIEVTFRLDAAGLSVKAVNKTTGETVDTVIESSTGMNADELDEAKTRFASIKTSGQI